MAKRTKKTHPERAVLKGSGGEYVVTKVQMLFETTKLLAKKFLKLFEATIENYLTDESNVFIVFWGMFPHSFPIFHTIYFWHTKHKHLIINPYQFHSSFWHADCDYE